MVDVMIRTGTYGDWFGAVPDGISLDTLAASPHGLDLGPLVPRLPSALRTPSGTVELAPPAVIADLDRLAATLDAPAADPEALVLIGRRQLRSNNSWMHNVNVLAKGRYRCTLLVHPDDAARLGLEHGADAEVRSAGRRGERPRRGHRRHEPGCGVAPPRLGPRPPRSARSAWPVSGPA